MRGKGNVYGKLLKSIIYSSDSSFHKKQEVL